MNPRLASRIARRTLGSAATCFVWLQLGGAPNTLAELPVLDSQEAIPSTEEIADPLAAEPLTLESWPTWRQQYLQWYYDRFSRTQDLSEKMREFVQAQAAWVSRRTLRYLLGR